jgi:NADP-dependent 3-hydroxy-3-methylglutaryl-CoA reductase
MSSDFAQTADLQIVRYSQVWEDHRVLEDALRITTEDDVLSICSSGDNVLALLLRGAASVTAIDVSSAQAALLDLKLKAIAGLSHSDFLILLGIEPGDAPARYGVIRDTLSEETRVFWDARPELLREGIVHSGRLERYFHGFQREYLSRLHSKETIARLLSFDEVREQALYFDDVIATPEFCAAFRSYFGRENLQTRGRDPAQFRYVSAEDVGSEFLRRLRALCGRTLLGSSPYMTYFFTGRVAAAAHRVPYLRAENYARLRSLLPRVRLVVSDLRAYLEAQPEGAFSKANLSDIFEYMSASDSGVLLQILGERIRAGGRIAYWNLLVERSSQQHRVPRLKNLHEESRRLHDRDRLFFYQAFQVEEVVSSFKQTSGPLKEDEKIPARGVYTEAARHERLRWLHGKTDADLSGIESTRLVAERLTGNIENFLGGVEVPVGLAGPLLFRGQQVRGTLYAPLATTEGALVASATRGATAITRSGGVVTRVIAQRMMRVPLFVLSSIDGALQFASWIRQNTEALREQVRTVSRHANLISVDPTLLGKLVYVTFLYETGDAAGQNMTTSCTWQACQWLMSQVQSIRGILVESFIIESNVSGDKKVTFQSFTAGRGIRVIAECLLDRAVMKQVLKVTPEELYSAYAMFVAGSIHVGMVGFNINVSNIIAGIFAATGQDIACVHECSLGQLVLQMVDQDLYASMVLPSLIVGTVGGGTHLPAQQGLLKMMGCYGVGHVQRLAEIIAAFCLALDLSTLSAVASGEFASAHEKLGRNRTVRWLTREELQPAFFAPSLRRSLGDPELVVESVQPEPLEMGSSIITELTSRKVNKLVGHFPMRLEYRRSDGSRDAVSVVLKVKPLDEEVVLMVNVIAQACGGRLAAAHSRFRHRTGLVGCHVRELGVYEQTDPRLLRNMPRIYGTIRNDERETFAVIMERLTDMLLMNTADDVRDWRPEHIEAALRGIGEAHSVWYRREEELLKQPWLGPVQTTASMVEMGELWDALMVHGANEFPEFVTEEELEIMRSLARDLPEWWSVLEKMPRTLIHNDFNPRNLGFRRDGLRLCAYDWELATLHVPQHDLAELLCFVLSDKPDPREVDHYIELHRRTLSEWSGFEIDAQQWREGYRLALFDFAINRLCMYLMAHTVRRYGFIKRVLHTTRALLLMERARTQAQAQTQA